MRKTIGKQTSVAYNYPGGNKSLSERLDGLLELLNRIEHVKFEPGIFVFYMYYDPNWKSVAKDLNVEFIN